MRITHLHLANWRNFKNVEVDLTDRVLLFGPNASGKSNLLDSIRFLRDLTTEPGGLRYAVNQRGGVSRLKFLNARNNRSGRVSIGVTLGTDEQPRMWDYQLEFTADKKTKVPHVVTEVVKHDGKQVYSTPEHSEDSELATQTALEQVSQNRRFAELASFLSAIEYLHLVPQVVRQPGRGGSGEYDPYGASFLSEIGRCPKRDFERRRKIMETALRFAVPQFESLDRFQDRDGIWHLQARYRSFRPNASAQDERDFSDGTLRLIGLLWVLTDRSTPSAPVLLEEPELSLHAEILKVLPAMLSQAARAGKRQVVASSHGFSMLSDDGLSADELVLLLPGAEGTTVKVASSDPMVLKLMTEGSFNLGEAVLADLVLPAISELATLRMS